MFDNATIGIMGLYLLKYMAVVPVSENTIINLALISYAICTAEDAIVSFMTNGRGVLKIL